MMNLRCNNIGVYPSGQVNLHSRDFYNNLDAVTWLEIEKEVNLYLHNIFIYTYTCTDKKIFSQNKIMYKKIIH